MLILVFIVNSFFSNIHVANKNADLLKTDFYLNGCLTKSGKKKVLLERHLRILDSVVNENPTDTIYRCCMQSIYFIVKATKIEVSTDGTTLGRISFSKADWLKWHAWYDKRYKSKRK